MTGETPDRPTALCGAETAKAIENFPVSGEPMPRAPGTTGGDRPVVIDRRC